MLASALAALTLATPLPAQVVQARHHPEVLLDTAKAYALALREVCLPAVRAGRPVSDFVGAADALPVDPALASPGLTQVFGVWRVLSRQAVYIVAWRDSSCQVAAYEGDPQAVAQAARAVFDAPPAPMNAVHLGDEARPAFCEGGPSHPIMATLRVSTRAGEIPASSTVWRWKGGEPLTQCAPH